VVALQPVDTIVLLEPGREVSQELALSDAEVRGPANTFAAPERHHRGGAFRRKYLHAIGLDPADAPCVCAEEERLTDSPLVNEFLVDFADAQAARRIDAILPRVGDGAAAGQCEPLAAR